MPPDLSALFINGTLKPSPQTSHTQGLIDRSVEIMQTQGVSTEVIRAVDHPIAPGMSPDMREEGWEDDAWPEIFKKVLAADILVLGTPIWLGDKSSVCTRIVERLYSCSGMTNERGQYIYYGRVGGCLVSGNEDGLKHCGMNLLYSLQHIGFTIPPQADTGWVGEAGPGPSYLDPDSGGPENEFTNQTLETMSWNLMHMATMLKRAGGIPAAGNSQ